MFPSLSSLQQSAVRTWKDSPLTGTSSFPLATLPPSAARLWSSDSTAIPEGTAVLLLFFVAAQQHLWEGHRQILMSL